MGLSTAYARLFLRGLAWDASENGETLYNTLKASARAKLTSTEKGQFLTAAAGNGTSVQFGLPSVRDCTPQEIAELTSQLLDLWDRVYAEQTDPTDDEMLTALLAELQPRRTFDVRMTTLRSYA